MEWLNYHHLFYFWTVVKAGSIHKAGLELRISPPAISTQLKLLEDQLGEKLLVRAGRRLVLTETGTTVFGYAEDIFSLGRIAGCGEEPSDRSPIALGRRGG